MAIYDDPENPPQPDEDSPATSPPPPPPPAPPSDADAKAKRKADIVNGIIIPYYRSRAGRDPTQSEIDSDYEHYERYGGDSFRHTIDVRFPTTPSASSGHPSDWFGQNAPNFGAPPAAFGETYTAGTYTPATFNEPFNAPTAESLLNDPGFIASRNAMQQGLERSAAAKGSVLSGGFVGRALPRALGEFTSNAYENAYGRAFDTYRQKYGMFSDAAAREADAFRTNELGRLNQYQTRYNSYRDFIAAQRQAEIDRWQREMDLAHLGEDATKASA